MGGGAAVVAPGTGVVRLGLRQQGNGFFTGGVHTQPPFSRLQRVDGRLKRLVESAEVDAVEEAVIHLYRHPQRLAACAVRNVFSPSNAGDVVVAVKIALVGQGREVEPGGAGK